MKRWVRGAFIAGVLGVAREDILLGNDTNYHHLRDNLVDDPYLYDLRSACSRQESFAFDCIKYGVLERFEDFLSTDHSLGKHASLIKSHRKIDMDQAEGRSLPGLAGYLARKAWEYTALTDLVIELPKQDDMRIRLAGDDNQPRFIDEIFHEYNTIDNKHQKPHIRNQLSKLFIPLLIILKIFKLKLLFLLPLILGVASFKKLIGFLAILIPGVIGYLKLCRSGFDYGAHGHSNFYNRPPHHRRQDHPDLDTSYDPIAPEFSNVHPDYLPDYESQKNQIRYVNPMKYHSKKKGSHASPTYESNQGLNADAYKSNQGTSYKSSQASSISSQSNEGPINTYKPNQVPLSTYQSNVNPSSSYQFKQETTPDSYLPNQETSSSHDAYKWTTTIDQTDQSPSPFQSNQGSSYMSNEWSVLNPQSTQGYESHSSSNSNEGFIDSDQTLKSDFWKNQPDYLPYKGYYNEKSSN